MTTPSEPRPEDLRADRVGSGDDAAGEPEPGAEVTGIEPDSLSQGAEPTSESAPGELPDESMGPP